MIRLTEHIWLGVAADEAWADLRAAKVGAILNVAVDLLPTRGWRQDLWYMHVGLVDGPGNPTAAYVAAVLALATLLERSDVLVCCHSGSRSLVVAAMYMNATAWHQRELDACVDVLFERGADVNLIPEVHEAHAEAFGRMNWRLLERLMGV